MTDRIRVEEAEDEQETKEWKREIEKTRKKIKELEQPPKPDQTTPGQQPAQ